MKSLIIKPKSSRKKKEIQKLDKKCDNLASEIQNMRRELKCFKSGKNNAEKLEKKQKSNDVKVATESENNNEKQDKTKNISNAEFSNVFDIKLLPTVSTSFSELSNLDSEITSSRSGPTSPQTPKSTLREHSQETPTTRFSLTCQKLIKLIEDRETDEAKEEVT